MSVHNSYIMNIFYRCIEYFCPIEGMDSRKYILFNLVSIQSQTDPGIKLPILPTYILSNDLN